MENNGGATASALLGADKSSILEGVLNNLFECMNDKDESVRHSIQVSLVKILEKHPDDAINALTEYRAKHPKLGDQTMSILLRVVENVANFNIQLKEITLSKIISFAIDELTRSHDHVPTVQIPAMEILVAIGRKHCEMVIESLLAHTKPGAIHHFMIMHCLGTLATANVDGMTPFIKNILASIIPNLGGIKLDHVKQAHAFAIGRFSEALLEQDSNSTPNASQRGEERKEEVTEPQETEENSKEENGEEPNKNHEPDNSCATEISVAYDVLFNQWLHSREPKVCVEILQALSSMYPLLPADKIQDQSARLISSILALYRRSIDRNAVTQFLASVLKTTISLQVGTLDSIADSLVTNLFDLVCVYPDYEKPQTVKGHFEVLRCFQLLSDIYANKILDMILMQLRNNSERERIKALLVLQHLTNCASESVAGKLHGFIEVLKQMILAEKSIKMKMTLLKTIVALAQKSFIRDKEFVWFIVRHSCKYNKVNTEHGTLEEHTEFMQTCQNSLYMLTSTVGTMDDLLKRELLNYFVLLDYTDIAGTITKCLGSLFARDVNIEFDVASEEDAKEGDGQASKGKIVVPSPETVFARCLALMGNFKEMQRISNILSFLQYYYPHLHEDLNELWDHKLPELMLCNGKESLFYDTLFEFITESVGFLNSRDTNFAERLVNKMADQLSIYPIHVPTTCEFFVSDLSLERGMLLKAVGLSVCHVLEKQAVEAKIDLIVGAAKQEKLDKHTPHDEYEERISSAAKALGFIAKSHLRVVVKKLSDLVHIGNRKHSTGFFSNLHFMKDTHKELENYKSNLLVCEAFGHIVENAPPVESLKNIDETMITFLIQQLTETKDLIMKRAILRTLLCICEQFLKTKDSNCELKLKNEIIQAVFSIQIEVPYENLPLLPSILKVGTDLIRIETEEQYDSGVLFEIACKNFFTSAQNLKTKFDSQEEDERNSFLAQHLNQSLPELNALVKTIIECDPSPACLDLVISILEVWTRDRNSEVRICASHVLNNSLEVYTKSMKLGCEAPSKFNQTGQMLGKIVPRCIDSNATVRQISVEILQKTLEISCIYETLTIADGSVDWVKDIERVRDAIVTDDSKEIYQLAGDIAKIIALRMSSFQYLQFCKTLLQCLDDPEQSSAIGASVVLKFFIQQKGSELFHAIPDLVKDSFGAIKTCEISRAKSGVLKAMVALTKHHPKLVCSEMLAQQLPFEENVVEYWHTVCTDLELTAVILDNFLTILSASCLYEPNEGGGDRQKIASVQPFSIFCALKEMFPCKEIKSELKHKFPELFAMLLTSLATYTNLAPPMLTPRHSPLSGAKMPGLPATTKSKFGFVPNKDAVKLNPCQIVLESFQSFLGNLEMEEISTVLTVCPQLALSADLKNFIELLTPMAVGITKQFTIASGAMKQIVTALSKYVSSPYDGQRVAAIGLYSQLVPLKPWGEVSSTIMFHLSSALSDPNPVVRGLCIRGLGFVGCLNEHDLEKYTETAITALLKGIDDNNNDCLINIPLESKRGLSRILQTLPSDRVESFHVSLAIRIRPFFSNPSTEIREAAIILFGDLCESKMATVNDGSLSPNCSSEALREQLFANFFCLLLHLSETEPIIIRACKGTLRKVCALLNAPKVNEMAQKHLIDHGQLHYNVFIVDFVKLIGTELGDHIQDFIESCTPLLKSHWSEIRGNAAIIIGILHNFLHKHNHHSEVVGHKIAILLKDESPTVRTKAATALGYFFGDI